MICRSRIKMMLYWEFVLPYIVVSESIIVKRLKWVMMIQYCYMGTHPLMHRCIPYVYCSSKLSMFYWCLIVWSGYCCSKYIYQFVLGLWYLGLTLSLTTDIMYISVFPGFWKVDSNDLHVGTTNDCICCFCQLSIHVGTCSICRPWFLWGLLGCWALPSHL